MKLTSSLFLKVGFAVGVGLLSLPRAVAAGCGCAADGTVPITIRIAGIKSITFTSEGRELKLTEHNPEGILHAKPGAANKVIAIDADGKFDDYPNSCDSAAVTISAPCGYRTEDGESSKVFSWKAEKDDNSNEFDQLKGSVGFSTTVSEIPDDGTDGPPGDPGRGGPGGGGDSGGAGGPGGVSIQFPSPQVNPDAGGVTLDPKPFSIQSSIPLGYDTQPSEGRYPTMGSLSLSYPMTATQPGLQHFQVGSAAFDAGHATDSTRKVFWSSTTADPRVLVFPEGALKLSSTATGVKAESFARAAFNAVSGAIAPGYKPVSTYLFEKEAAGSKIIVQKWIYTERTDDPTYAETYWLNGSMFYELVGGRQTETMVNDDLASVTLTGGAVADEALIRNAEKVVMRTVRDTATAGNPVVSQTIEKFAYIPKRDWDPFQAPPVLGNVVNDIQEVRTFSHQDLDADGAVDAGEPVDEWEYYGQEALPLEKYGLLLGRLKYHERTDGYWELHGFEPIQTLETDAEGVTRLIETTGSQSVVYSPWKDTLPPDVSTIGVVGYSSDAPTFNGDVEVRIDSSVLSYDAVTDGTEELHVGVNGGKHSLSSDAGSESNAAKMATHSQEYCGLWTAGGGFLKGDPAQSHRMTVTTYGTRDSDAPYENIYADDLKVAPGYSKQEVEIYGRSGLLVRETKILPAGAAGTMNESKFETATKETYAYDARHRLIEVRRDGRLVSTRAYPDEHSVLETNEEGVATLTKWDALGRVAETTVLAGGGVGDIATTYEYAGLENRVKVNGVLVGLSIEDMAGRTLSRQDQTGAVTTWNYGSDGRTTTETRPDGGTLITHQYRDGRTESVTGTAVVARYYDYDFELDWNYFADLPVETEWLGLRNGPRAIRTKYRWDGQVVDVATPNAASGALDIVNINNTLSRRDGVAWSKPQPSGGVEAAGTVRYPAYETVPVSRRTAGGAMGMHVFSGYATDWNHTVPAAGAATRLSESHTFYVKEGGYWWEKTVSRRGIESAAATVESSTMTRLWQGEVDGSNEDGVVVKSVSADGEISQSVTTFNPGALESRITVTSNRSTVPMITQRVNGYAQWVQGQHSSASEHRASYSYDSFGRITAVRDHRGAITRTVYDTVGRVVKTIDALGRSTGYGYVPSGQPGAGQVALITKPDGTTSAYTYTLRGEVASITGTSEYPQALTYNLYGDRETLTTTNAAGASVTRWEYNPAGLVKTKYYGYAAGHTPATTGTVNYVYDPFGRLETKSVAGGKTTRYQTNAFGEISTIDYGNNAGIDATLGRDAAGLVTTATENYEDASGTVIGGGTTTLSYVAGRLDSVQYDNAHSYLPGVKLDYKNLDATGRSTGYEAFNGTTSRLNVTYGYDTTGRLSTVGSAHGTFTYAYLPGSGIVGGYTGANPGTVISQKRHVDFQNRISSVVTRNGSNVILSSVAYSHDAADRRTQARREDGGWWNYAYNIRGEVARARRHTASGASIDGLQRKYHYDDIGNRTSAQFGAGGENATLSEIGYQVNAYNQYTSITHPGEDWVVGRAPEGVAVNVNGQPAGRQETWFSEELSAANETGPVYPSVEVRDGSGNLAEQGQGNLVIPKAVSTPGHDAAGNLELDDRWRYEWDSENRLRKMTPTPEALTAGFPNRTVEFVYDWQGRRIAKKITQGSTVSHRRYLYENWNAVAEWTLHGTSTTFLTPQTYLWGLDLAGQMSGEISQLQGAGGVGGLLAASVIKTSDSSSLGNLYASYDGNGNILAWSAQDGSIKQSQDYDAFGNIVLKRTPTGSPLATSQGELSYGFSTKPQDAETKLLYYGYRYYDPVTGRWISKDLLEEYEYSNIYIFSGNGAISKCDVLGLLEFPPTYPDYGSSSEEDSNIDTKGSASGSHELVVQMIARVKGGGSASSTILLAALPGGSIEMVISISGEISPCQASDGSVGLQLVGSATAEINGGIGYVLGDKNLKAKNVQGGKYVVTKDKNTGKEKKGDSGGTNNPDVNSSGGSVSAGLNLCRCETTAELQFNIGARGVGGVKFWGGIVDVPFGTVGTNETKWDFKPRIDGSWGMGQPIGARIELYGNATTKGKWATKK